MQPTVVVPAFGRPESTRRALRSLARAGAVRVVLVDDGGCGHGDELGREFPGVEVLRTERAVYWTGAIRVGIEHALANGAGSVLFFNQDVTLAPGYFERLAATAARHEGAVIGSAVVYAQEEGLVWSAGARMEWLGRGFRVLHHGGSVDRLPETPFPVDWLFGMGTCVPAGVFERIGLPDADRFPMAWGDADFTLRARGAGIPILLDPGLRLSHEVGRYDARVAPAPSFAEYVSWLRSPTHNISRRPSARSGGVTPRERCGASPSPCGSPSSSSTSCASDSCSGKEGGGPTGPHFPLAATPPGATGPPADEAHARC